MTYLTITQRIENADSVDATLTLPYELRQKSRLKTTLDDGREAGLILDRGKVLRDGDLLCAKDGTVVQVRAAPEQVSTLHCTDPLMLSRASYHLGNRHVPLHISENLLRYQQDHVLDAMIESLGLSVTHEMAPFEPESGAYHNGHAGGHSHGHDDHSHNDHSHDGHGHTHVHSHQHE